MSHLHTALYCPHTVNGDVAQSWWCGTVRPIVTNYSTQYTSTSYYVITLSDSSLNHRILIHHESLKTGNNESITCSARIYQIDDTQVVTTSNISYVNSLVQTNACEVTSSASNSIVRDSITYESRAHIVCTFRSKSDLYRSSARRKGHYIISFHKHSCGDQVMV